MAEDFEDRGVSCSGWDHSGCEGSRYCPPRCPRFVDRAGAALLIEPYEPDWWDALVGMYEIIGVGSITLGLPPASTERTER